MCFSLPFFNFHFWIVRHVHQTENQLTCELILTPMHPVGHQIFGEVSAPSPNNTKHPSAMLSPHSCSSFPYCNCIFTYISTVSESEFPYGRHLISFGYFIRASATLLMPSVINISGLKCIQLKLIFNSDYSWKHSTRLVKTLRNSFRPI